MKIVISGPAAAFLSGDQQVTDVETLRSLDGLVYEEEVCASFLSEAFDDIGLEGGSLRIAFDASTHCLRVVTEYQASRRLGKRELAALIEETRGQWSDGIGESCFGDYEDRTGIGISVFPIPYAHNEVRAQQIDDGLKPSPHFSPGFGILGRSGKADWSIARRGIAVAMAQGGSAKVQSQSGPKTE